MPTIVNQTNDAIQNLPTVSFAYKLTYVSIYNNHYIHMQLPLNKIQRMIEALFWDKDSGSRSAMFIYIV